MNLNLNFKNCKNLNECHNVSTSSFLNQFHNRTQYYSLDVALCHVGYIGSSLVCDIIYREKDCLECLLWPIILFLFVQNCESCLVRFYY